LVEHARKGGLYAGFVKKTAANARAAEWLFYMVSSLLFNSIVSFCCNEFQSRRFISVVFPYLVQPELLVLSLGEDLSTMLTLTLFVPTLFVPSGEQLKSSISFDTFLQLRSVDQQVLKLSGAESTSGFDNPKKAIKLVQCFETHEVLARELGDATDSSDIRRHLVSELQSVIRANDKVEMVDE
jgi:hypothetical protein